MPGTTGRIQWTSETFTKTMNLVKVFFYACAIQCENSNGSIAGGKERIAKLQHEKKEETFYDGWTVPWKAY
jgi:hypothetical protein